MNEAKKHERTRANLIQLLMRVPVPWVFVLTYLVGVGLEFLFPLRNQSPEMLLLGKPAGIVLLAIGAGLASWSLFIFHKLRTTTVPGETSTNLVTWGPYRFSRNPMYVSLILAYLGEVGILAQNWPLILLPFTVAYLNWIIIPVEEARLTEVFEQNYKLYCTRVRRWI